MRSTDERMREVLGRAKARESARRRQRQRAIVVGGGVLSVMVVVLVSLGMSQMAPSSESVLMSGQLGLMGSTLSGGSALGYVVVGLFGFVLGATVTVLVYRTGRPTSRKRRAQDERRKP